MNISNNEKQNGQGVASEREGQSTGLEAALKQSVSLAARIKSAIRKLPAETIPGEFNYNEGRTVVELNAVLKAIDETRARFDASAQ